VLAIRQVAPARQYAKDKVSDKATAQKAAAEEALKADKIVRERANEQTKKLYAALL
jgi:hypothetical protein